MRRFQEEEHEASSCGVGQSPVAGNTEAQRKFARVGNVFRMLHALRQICNHPCSLDFDKWPELQKPAGLASDVEASGKTMLMQVLLEQIFGQAEKVIIFCQYIRTVELLAAQISSRFGITPFTLMGETPPDERAKRVMSFQKAQGAGAMVLTLGVGGTGLTLHAACHVIHFDRCYNPARENQGTDRAHRIGQVASSVFVHRLVCRGTFEERVDAILEQKQRLCGLAVPGAGEHSPERVLAELSNAQLAQLFAAGRAWDGAT